VQKRTRWSRRHSGEGAPLPPSRPGLPSPSDPCSRPRTRSRPRPCPEEPGGSAHPAPQGGCRGPGVAVRPSAPEKLRLPPMAAGGLFGQAGASGVSGTHVVRSDQRGYTINDHFNCENEVKEDFQKISCISEAVKSTIVV